MADNEVGMIPARNSFDLATLLGLFAAFGLVVVTIITVRAPNLSMKFPENFVVLTARWRSRLFFFLSMKSPKSSQLSQSLYSIRGHPDITMQAIQIVQLPRNNRIFSLQQVPDSLKSEQFLHKTASPIVYGFPVGQFDPPTFSSCVGEALLTTFYNANLTNLPFIPLNSKRSATPTSRK